MRDRAALKRAARAAIFMPAVFALANEVIQQPQTSIFAAFGSFAILVLVEFAGPPRTRLLAYLGLACAGAVFITLGTLCSRNAWLGAGAMAIVGFATLYSGVLSGFFAAGATGGVVRPRSGGCGRQLVPAELQEVVGGSDQAPFRANGRPASSFEGLDPTVRLDLAEEF